MIYDEKIICNILIYEWQKCIGDNLKGKWKSNLLIKSKPRTYITFKDNYSTVLKNM